MLGYPQVWEHQAMQKNRYQSHGAHTHFGMQRQGGQEVAGPTGTGVGKFSQAANTLLGSFVVST